MRPHNHLKKSYPVSLITLLLILVFVPAVTFAAEPSPEQLESLVRSLKASQIADFEKLAETGDPKAQTLIGLMKTRHAQMLDRAGDRDSAKIGDEYREAASWYRKAAEQNYAPAQYFLAEAYETQKGFALDCKEVAKWLGKAIDSEYPAAMRYMSYLYQTNRCVEQDSSKALALYKRGGALGNARANSLVGDLYANGSGVPEDQKEANVWYLKAAEQGDSSAQNEIATRYAEAIGVDRDNRAAVRWFKESAEQGNVFGACNLGLHYARGQGVGKNPVLALKWAFISHSLDGLKCAPNDFIDFLKPTKAQTNSAWQLAEAWLRSHPDLTNDFGETPWIKTKRQRSKRR